ncbi:MAG: DUF362 domain-containing protein [Patescibacteria group bacterium]|nr:DUF362 domain-containing protein [Patescibacteria group bacterium]
MDKAEVYFIKLNELNKIKNLLPEFPPPLGVKVHFGEEGNVTYLPAAYVKEIAGMVENPALVECNVLYKSPRSQAETHKKLAREHGFDFAEIDILDGEFGDDVDSIKIKGEFFKECFLGSGLSKYKSLLVISHFKGHISSGFGGSIKNLSMGLAGRRGKLALHAFVKHQVEQEKCTACGACIANCPAEAIAFDESGKAKINIGKCISCSKCIAVCPTSAISIPWGEKDISIFRKRLAEYALAGIKGKKCFYINFLANITKLCDCAGEKMEPMTDDIGILISADPVAIDQASYDLVVKQCKDFAKQNGDEQLEHGEKIGLGTRGYEIIAL